MLIYDDMVRKAMIIAESAFHGLVDKGGYPYVAHPLHLAEQMDSVESICVALLHDVVEDTEYTLEQLSAEGFSPRIIEAVGVMTRDKRVPYAEYIKLVAENDLAKQVKIADLRHNLTSSRVGGKLPTSLEQRYMAALELLAADSEE